MEKYLLQIRFEQNGKKFYTDEIFFSHANKLGDAFFDALRSLDKENIAFLTHNDLCRLVKRHLYQYEKEYVSIQGAKELSILLDVTDKINPNGFGSISFWTDREMIASLYVVFDLSSFQYQRHHFELDGAIYEEEVYNSIRNGYIPTEGKIKDYFELTE